MNSAAVENIFVAKNQEEVDRALSQGLVKETDIIKLTQNDIILPDVKKDDENSKLLDNEDKDENFNKDEEIKKDEEINKDEDIDKDETQDKDDVIEKNEDVDKIGESSEDNFKDEHSENEFEVIDDYIESPLHQEKHELSNNEVIDEINELETIPGVNETNGESLLTQKDDSTGLDEAEHNDPIDGNEAGGRGNPGQGIGDKDNVVETIPEGMKVKWVRDPQTNNLVKTLVEKDKIDQKRLIRKAGSNTDTTRKVIIDRRKFMGRDDEEVHSSLKKVDAAEEIRKAREERKRKAQEEARNRGVGDQPVEIETERDPGELRREMHKKLKDKIKPPGTPKNDNEPKKKVVYTGKAYSWDGAFEKFANKPQRIRNMLVRSAVSGSTDEELLDYDKSTNEVNKDPIIIRELQQRQIGRFADPLAEERKRREMERLQREQKIQFKRDLKIKSGDELKSMLAQGKNTGDIIREMQRRERVKNAPKKHKKAGNNTGGRVNFLASIRKGKDLKKTGGPRKQVKRPKTMIEQLRERQKKQKNDTPEHRMARDLILGTTTFEEPKKEYINLDYDAVMKIVEEKYKNNNRLNAVRDKYKEYQDEWE
ncbi:MAG: hypothetical protein HRT87_11645 [Legionellales bacterium]|nr:hypothetical protein [Legionellales bacterium]